MKSMLSALFIKGLSIPTESCVNGSDHYVFLISTCGKHRFKQADYRLAYFDYGDRVRVKSIRKLAENLIQIRDLCRDQGWGQLLVQDEDWYTAQGSGLY